MALSHFWLLINLKQWLADCKTNSPSQFLPQITFACLVLPGSLGILPQIYCVSFGVCMIFWRLPSVETISFNPQSIRSFCIFSFKYLVMTDSGIWGVPATVRIWSFRKMNKNHPNLSWNSLTQWPWISYFIPCHAEYHWVGKMNGEWLERWIILFRGKISGIKY